MDAGRRNAVASDFSHCLKPLGFQSKLYQAHRHLLRPMAPALLMQQMT
jgi:hypothetical protein